MRRLFWTYVILLLLLAACSQDEPASATRTAVPTVTAAQPTVQPTETAVPPTAARPTITPEPTPLVPAIEAGDQALNEDGRIVIDRVVAADDSWLVLLADEDGEPGAILGYVPVMTGENTGVTVEIVPETATPLIYARLHLDAGDLGEFEYPGPDTVVSTAAAEMVTAIGLDIQLPIPAVTASDQEIGVDGLVTVDSVLLTEPGWLVIHRLDGSEIGPALGQIALPAGESSAVTLPIRWREAANNLAAVLYADAEQPGGLDSRLDLPVVVGGSPVAARFEVTLPPDITVHDQPVVNGRIVVDRAISPTEGWLVVYTAEDEQVGVIIGFEPVAAGVNELLEIEVVETAVTPQLFLLFHEETADPAEFEFPAADPPGSYEDQIIAPFLMLTNPGNALITMDQPLDPRGEVLVPLVIADLDVWLAIYTQDEDGAADMLVGALWLPAGVNRDNKVSLTTTVDAGPLLARLHLDAATPQEFDYPDGEDTPLLRNRRNIEVPFLLTEPVGTDGFNPGS